MTALRAAGISLTVICAGCSWFGPSVPREVRVPVPVPCVRSLPEQPEVLDEAQLLALNDYQLPIGLDADRRAWRQHAKNLEVILTACIGAP